MTTPLHRLNFDGSFSTFIISRSSAGTTTHSDNNNDNDAATEPVTSIIIKSILVLFPTLLLVIHLLNRLLQREIHDVLRIIQQIHHRLLPLTKSTIAFVIQESLLPRLCNYIILSLTIPMHHSSLSLLRVLLLRNSNQFQYPLPVTTTILIMLRVPSIQTSNQIKFQLLSLLLWTTLPTSILPTLILPTIKTTILHSNLFYFLLSQIEFQLPTTIIIIIILQRMLLLISSTLLLMSLVPQQAHILQKLPTI
mmetsp:Transcript_37924/g.42311  ORF Transcript_37924/g.42311 Transcript_37924/m.42311 type:complete len:251 (+) Transcript_37924:1465-2217(+)